MLWLRVTLTAVAMVTLGAGTVAADDFDATSIQLHGFIAQGTLLTSDNNYLAQTQRGSLELSEAGVNFVKQLDDRLSIGAQLFARRLGREGDYSAKFDWFELDYRWRDWLGLRAGRVKLPYGLYNDTSDIDAAQPVVLLPQSVYPATNRNFLLAQTGVELYGYRPLDSGGALDYRVYFGTLYLSIPESATVQFASLDVPYITGGRVIWEAPVDGLRIGVSGLAGEIEGEYALTAAPTAAMALRLVQYSALGSVEYAAGDLVVAAEYGRARNRTTVNGVEARQTSEQAYALATYRWRSWVETTAYYSLLFPDVTERSGRDHHEYDTALSFRFDVTAHWLVKLEGHYLRGTAALSPDLNGGTPQSDLVNAWWLFAAKTTVYF